MENGKYTLIHTSGWQNIEMDISLLKRYLRHWQKLEFELTAYLPVGLHLSRRNPLALIDKLDLFLLYAEPDYLYILSRCVTVVIKAKLCFITGFKLQLVSNYIDIFPT